MQKKSHVMVAWFLSFLIVFTPYYGHSKPFLKDPALDDKVYLLREQILYDYAQVKNISQFVRVFAAGRSGAEKSEITERLLRLEKLPVMRRAQNGFVVSASGYSIKVEIVSLSERRFLVNGLPYTADPKLSLIEQADQMGRLLRDANPKKYSHLLLLLPQANAIFALGAIVLAGLALVTTTTLQLLINRYGASGLEALEWHVCDRVWKPDLSDPNRNPKWCKGYLEEKEKMLKNAPENTAVKNALSSSSSNGEIFSTLSEKCPFETQDKYYQGQIRILREQKSESANKDEQINILAEFAGGKLKHIKVNQFVYEDGTLKQKPMATYEVDAEAILTSIVLPTGVKISSAADLKDDPVMQAEQTLHKKIFAYIGSRMGGCKLKQQESEAQKIDTHDKADKKPVEVGGRR